MNNYSSKNYIMSILFFLFAYLSSITLLYAAPTHVAPVSYSYGFSGSYEVLNNPSCTCTCQVPFCELGSPSPTLTPTTFNTISIPATRPSFPPTLLPTLFPTSGGSNFPTESPTILVSLF